MATICLLNSLFPPDAQGGAENYVLRTAKALDARDHSVSVLTTKPYDGPRSLHPARESYERLDVWQFFPLNVSHRTAGTGRTTLQKACWHALDMANFHTAYAIDRVLSRLRPDVVHSNNLLGLSTLVGRVLDLGRHDTRHVHTLHGYSLLSPSREFLVERRNGRPEPRQTLSLSNRLYARGKRLTFGTPDVVTAPSSHIIDLHRAHGFFGGVECRRLRLGIDDVADAPPTVSGDPLVLYVGKHQRMKGLDTLFAAARSLPEVSFELCGTGPYAEKSAARAADLDNVTYHGFVPDEELRRLRRGASLAVVPSISLDNSPFVIYEHFAAGLPVIGSDVGGIPELIDSDTGALFEAGNADDLADRLEALVADETALETMSENARTWAGTHTTERHVTRLLSDVYELPSVD